jgi:deoxyadenosine/deoxycytidine kinase
LHLGDLSRSVILPHLAFRDGCSYVFLVGLPGAGKSYIRSRLAKELGRLRIEYQSLSDYPYAYLDFTRSLLKLSPAYGNSFRVQERGAFAVQNEKALSPALQALHADIRDSNSEAREVTLVEFARSDLTAALQEFDDIRPRAHVIYVSAPADLRQKRLADRAVPPEIRIAGETIMIDLSDNHLLPACAERSLYGSDDLDAIKVSAHWRGRVFEIENNSDGNTQVDIRIREFIDMIVGPYVDHTATGN